MNVREARNHVGALLRNLKAIAGRDPEQEVLGMALPVIDAVLKAGRDALGDDPIVTTIRDAFSPEAIAEGQPLRAGDALIVVEQLHTALLLREHASPPEPPAVG